MASDRPEDIDTLIDQISERLAIRKRNGDASTLEEMMERLIARLRSGSAPVAWRVWQHERWETYDTIATAREASAKFLSPVIPLYLLAARPSPPPVEVEELAKADQLLGQLKRTITKSALPEIGKGILDADAQEKLAWCKQIEEARECFVRAAALSGEGR